MLLRISARLALISVPLLISAMVFSLVRQAQEANRLISAADSAYRIHSQLLVVLSHHQDMETGQRGYLITGDPQFLEPYSRARLANAKALAELQEAFAGGAEAQGRIGEIVRLSKAKQQFSAHTIALRREGKTAQAFDLLASGRGKRLTDAIRISIDRFVREQDARIDNVRQRSDTTLVQLHSRSLLLLAALLILLLIAVLVTRNILRSRQTLIDLLDDVSRRRTAILDAVTDTIVSIGPTGHIESISAGVGRSFGYHYSELLQRPVDMLFADNRPFMAVSARIRALPPEDRHAGLEEERIARRRDGRRFPVAVGIRTLDLPDGLHFVAAIRDITERKRVEALQAEFVATVSHELRTPMTAIAGSLGLLAGGVAGEMSGKAARLVRIASNNAERLIRLINDILDVEKIESGKMRFDRRAVALIEIAEQAIEANRAYASGFGVTLRIVAGSGEAVVEADPDRLVQVLDNLLSNGIKFSREGQAVELMIMPGADEHCIAVRDYGSGIPEEFRTRIFGKFAQADTGDKRSKGGTGLGLAIVREIVEQSGGTIRFESVEGEGTTFFVTLPSWQQPGSMLKDVASPACPAILVIGCDSPLFVKLREGLAVHGLRIERTDSLIAALHALENGDHGLVMVGPGLNGGEYSHLAAVIRRCGASGPLPLLLLGGSDDVEWSEKSTGRPTALAENEIKRVGVGERILQMIDGKTKTAGGREPRILHVEEGVNGGQILASALAGRAFLRPVGSIAGARDEMASGSYDLVTLDLMLVDRLWGELIPALKHPDGGSVPVLIVSSQDPGDEMVAALAAFPTRLRARSSELASTAGPLVPASPSMLEPAE